MYFMRKKNKSEGGESVRESCVPVTNENVKTSRSTWGGQSRTSTLIVQEFMAPRKRAKTQQLSYKIILDTVAVRHS